MSEEIDYRAERKARLYEDRRYRVAKEVYRDMLRFVMGERQRVHAQEPVDFDAHAAVAVEAAEAFLAALEPPEMVLPDYEG